MHLEPKVVRRYRRVVIGLFSTLAWLIVLGLVISAGGNIAGDVFALVSIAAGITIWTIRRHKRALTLKHPGYLMGVTGLVLLALVIVAPTRPVAEQQPQQVSAPPAPATPHARPAPSTPAAPTVPKEAQPAPQPVPSPTSATKTERPAPAPVEPTPDEQRCYNRGGVYTGDSTCYPGGELVKVARVIDGDTVELTDSRRVRILGVDAPERESCAGHGATGFTESKIGGRWVKLHQEPGVGQDRYGRELGYIQFEAGTPGIWSTDLGHDLTLSGWATPYEGGQANATYMDRIRSAYSIAEYRPDGMFAAPCGSPKTYAPTYTDNGDANPPDVGDGEDGESRFCRRHWYC